MITYEDCLALANLEPEMVDRVAAREGLTAIAALGLATRLDAAGTGELSPVRGVEPGCPNAAVRTASAPVRVIRMSLEAQRLAA